MIEPCAEDDPAANLLERKWFAAAHAAAAMKAECETLSNVLAMSHNAWRAARVKLAELEAVRDAFGTAMTRLEERSAAALREPEQRSAA